MGHCRPCVRHTQEGGVIVRHHQAIRPRLVDHLRCKESGLFVGVEIRYAGVWSDPRCGIMMSR